MMSEKRNDTLFIDKDDTFYGDGDLIVGAADFLAAQKQRGRDCVVVSAASENTARFHLTALDSHIDAYYGKEHTLSGHEFYEKDGVLRSLAEDFDSIYVPPGFNSAAYFQWVSKIDGTPLDRTKIYSNPFIPEVDDLKDLHLVRRCHFGAGYDSVKSVMLGDPESDLDAARGDPSTPFILVSDLRWATRDRVTNVLDTLFSGRMPAAVFDELYAVGVPTYEPHEVISRIGEEQFRLIRQARYTECRIVQEDDARRRSVTGSNLNRW